MAYGAGHETGKAIYDSEGKGAAVRETVWGGCTRRALDAKATEAVADRGAWVQGCLDGVANRPASPPTATVTSRTEDAELMVAFRSWVHATGGQKLAQHVSKLTVAQLTKTDYDIELTTDYIPASQEQANELARSFVTWWDGDNGRGEDGVARNVLVLGGDGKMLLAQRI
ncbi:hypothetical protein ACFYO5_35640 [Streptomyces sp. NPDC006259]|uniref:hypothetical protein n=1 Tax=Streptomyces sp. NPDC006259 TaxID=3364740 RepID=UPI0036AF8135